MVGGVEMRNAKELKDLSLTPSSESDQLQKLKDDFLDAVEKCYNEMITNPISRDFYRERILFRFSSACADNVAEEFAKYVKQYGYTTSKDPLYGCYTVVFDSSVCWNPYKSEIG